MGDTPDFRLDHNLTEGKRTYCLDHFHGAGEHIAAMDLYWRYDDRYVYLAVRITDPSYDSGVNSLRGVHRSLVVQLGGGYCRVVPDAGRISRLQGNMCAGYTETDGVSAFEFAAPRDQVMAEGGDSFLGSAEYTVTVRYVRPGETTDPSGIEWKEPIAPGLSATPDTDPFQTSCFYTDLLEIDENCAWLVYTDFKYPNKNGVPVKSVILRKITVTMDE